MIKDLLIFAAMILVASPYVIFGAAAHVRFMFGGQRR